MDGPGHDWTVFPFLHTFPAYDPSKSVWVDSTCSYCPRTAALLKSLPGIRTALFSRLGPGTAVSGQRLVLYFYCHYSVVILFIVCNMLL